MFRARTVLKLLALALTPAALFCFLHFRAEQARLRPLNEAFITCVQIGDIAAATTMLAKGADVNAYDPEKQSHHGDGTPRRPALLIATASNDLELVQFLLKHGADPNAADANEWSNRAVHGVVAGRDRYYACATI